MRHAGEPAAIGTLVAMSLLELVFTAGMIGLRGSAVGRGLLALVAWFMNWLRDRFGSWCSILRSTGIVVGAVVLWFALK